MKQAVDAVRCNDCERRIEVCEGCQEQSCAAPICLDCMKRSLGQSRPQPHVHGG